MVAKFDVTDIRRETERLSLRPWRQSDLDDLYDYARVEGVGEMAGWVHHKDKEESQRILNMFIDGKKTFALELKETGKIIGSLGIEVHNAEEFDDPDLQGRELGYVLSKEYWGQGLMPEAVAFVICYCFETLHYDFISCSHFERNPQSQRVIEKCGFTYVKDILYETQYDTVEPARLYVQYNPVLER